MFQKKTMVIFTLSCKDTESLPLKVLPACLVSKIKSLSQKTKKTAVTE